MYPEYPRYPTAGGQEELALKRKKYLLLGLAAAAVLLIIWLLTHLATSSSVLITTNDPQNIITIQETSPKNQTIDTKNHRGNLQMRLGHGSYVATAKNGYASAQKIFKVSGGGTTKVTLNVNQQPNQQGVLETVSDLGAYAIAADANTIKFIDRNHSPAKLYQVDSNNSLSVLGQGISFDSISWADTSFGVGHTDKKLMTIHGTAAADMSTPVSASTFTVAPDHDVYISDGSAIYKGSDGQNFTKVYTAASDEHLKIVSASNNAILLTNKGNTGSREGELIALQKDGTKKEIDGEAYEGVWSAKGTYVAVSGDTSTIFNNKLQQVVKLPIGNVVALAWLDDNTLVYGDGNLIWKFSVSDHQSSVLATTENGVGTISQLAPSSDGKSLYVSVQNTNISNGYTFYLARYRFNTEVTVNPVLQKLSLVLPNTLTGGCQVGYLNFTKLEITTSSTPDTEQTCIANAKSYLLGYNVDPNSVGMIFIPSSQFIGD